MKNNLPTNIRSLRKEKGLTQEQLADVFNISVGAVHKWEAGLSTPDITVLMELADFFGISLDSLVGFDASDNRSEVIVENLRKLTRRMDPSGPEQAELALKKYPNNFRVVSECAYLYRAYGAMFNINRDYCIKARDLYEQAIRLVDQSNDPAIDATVLYGHLASIYQMMEEYDKSLEIYKAHNAGYIYNTDIGTILTLQGKYKEAEVYLSYSLVNLIGKHINLIVSKALCYIGSRNYREARAILETGLNENSFYRRNEDPFYLDRIDCIYLAGLSFIALKEKKKEEAISHLKKAKTIAERFDEAPDHDARKERFVDIDEPCMAYDTTGETCIKSIENSITRLGSKELMRIWRSIN